MNRASEIEILAAKLEEPSRALIRAALTAQRQGRLDAAARVVADQVAKRPALGWVALIFALDATELRLAGAVSFTTPTTRFVASEDAPLFEERWGAIVVQTWPDGLKFQLKIERDKRSLCLHASPRAAIVGSLEACEAINVFAGELRAHFNCPVQVPGPS